MSDKKRKPGRPRQNPDEDPNITTRVAQRNFKHTLAIGEDVRNNTDPSLIRRFHNMVVAGMNPIWILDNNNDPIDVKPDPSPLAQTPDLAKKLESLKFLTAYGWGQPVQSTQVDIDIRARLDQMGSGASNRELEGAYSPEALKYLSQALKAVGRLPAPSDPNVVDAEWTDVKTPSDDESKGEVKENNPLPGNDSGDSSNQ